jgi:hypothetical protein
MIYFVIFFVLGVTFGYAVGWPWALVAFLVPLGLLLTASDKNGGAIVIGFVVTAIGLLVGFMLGARERQRARAT